MKDDEQSARQQGKTGMADCFVISMFSPKEYGKLLKLGTGKMVCYLLLLTLLVSVIQYAIPVLSAVAAMDGMKAIILNEMPQFSLKDGKLSVSQKLEQSDEQAGVYMILDTGVKEYQKEDIPENVIEAIMVSESNILVYNSLTGMGGMVQQTRFSDFKELSIDNQSVADKSGLIYAGMFSVFIMLWFFTMVKYLITALFYAFMMFILVRTITMDTTFKMVYVAALFAQSIGTIVAAVTYCVGNSLFIMAGGIFNVFITVSLMNRALIHIAKEGF